MVFGPGFGGKIDCVKDRNGVLHFVTSFKKILHKSLLIFINMIRMETLRNM